MVLTESTVYLVLVMRDQIELEKREQGNYTGVKHKRRSFRQTREIGWAVPWYWREDIVESFYCGRSCATVLDSMKLDL